MLRGLVLDEATSGLDVETERKVFDALRRLLPEVTLIVVTHRPASLRGWAKILLMEHGTIVASGTYAEVFERDESSCLMIEVN